MEPPARLLGAESALGGVELCAPASRAGESGRRGFRRHLHSIVFAAMLVVLALYATGVVTRVVYPLLTFGSVVSAVVGLRINRPQIRWPWLMFASAAVLWTITGVVESLVEASGDLSSNRSLLPDVFAVPGYLLIGAALLGLLRTRRSDQEHSALLDGLMLGGAVGLAVYEALLLPAFEIEHAWLPAVLTVVTYPTISVGLLVLAVRLAFSPGGRSPAFSLLLAGVFALHIGDVVYALGEIGQYQAPQSLRETPYLLAPTFFSAAVLHPTARGVTRQQVVSRVTLGRARAVTVTIALAAPSVLLAAHASSVTDMVSVCICVFLVSAAVTRTVTAMRQHAAAADRMYHRATHDDLTGLPGRALLFQQLDDLGDDPHVHHLTLMFVDLDRFKQINDTMGHAAGDELLCAAAIRVVSAVRDTDVVYRLSGDEFVVLAPNVDADDADALASRIRGVMRMEFRLSIGQVFSSASIGVATAPTGDPSCVRALLGEADEAMYASKQSGRDATTRFDVSMRQRTERRLEIERRLHEALDEDRIEVHYQPIVSGDAWAVTGFEALARWTVDGESMSPDEFIPVAEESGLIVPLGRYVLDAACAQLAEWRRDVPGTEGLTMSVNLSARQICSGDIVDVVAECLRRHQLPGGALWLEITESLMADDTVTTSAILAGLRGLGVQLAVDDFGTGYSSLSYLKRFPVSRVKIDRSFVTHMCHDQSDRSLVAAVVAMAGALGLEPVAEGVERPEQALLLRELGCDSMQGFLFGRPVASDEIWEMLDPSGESRRDRSVAAGRRCAHGRSSTGITALPQVRGPGGQ